VSNLSPLSNVKSYALQVAIKQVGEATISRLAEFYDKTNRIENEYKADAIRLVEYTLKNNSGTDTRQELVNLLMGLGFKKSSAYKIVGSTKFALQLEYQRSDATAWVKSLPVSSSYALAQCDEPTFNRIWATESEWGAKPVTRDRIEFLASQAKPILPEKKKGAILPEKISQLKQALTLCSDFPHITQSIQATIDELSTIDVQPRSV
jgi:hypothetical protein